MLNHQCRSNIYDLATKSEDWKSILNDQITDIYTLADYIKIDIQKLEEEYGYSNIAAAQFPLLVTKTFADRIEKQNLNDPLLMQILPRKQELEQHPTFCADPVGDKEAQLSDYLLQKYDGRALLLTNKSCSINCRFCFRKNLLHEIDSATETELNNVIEQIAADNSIKEIILSGGEPLLLDDHQLKLILNKIETIGHIQRIRFHTRMAITIPQRITKNLIHLLEQCSKQIIIITHCNHPNEIDSTVSKYLKQLASTNTALLNQTVLLKDINDHQNTLSELSQKLFKAGILPYYLHLLDKVKGAQHFQVDDTTAKIIWKQLQESLPGYLVPRLVRETAGENSKTIIC